MSEWLGEEGGWRDECGEWWFKWVRRCAVRKYIVTSYVSDFEFIKIYFDL